MVGTSVAVVGVGPRGLSVVERLVIRARTAVTVWAIDSVEHGSGRVWRTDQPEWFTMNATAGEVTVASPDGHLDGFVEWSGYAPTDYPPRRVYGEYLHDMFRRLCHQAPPHVT